MCNDAESTVRWFTSARAHTDTHIHFRNSVITIGNHIAFLLKTCVSQYFSDLKTYTGQNRTMLSWILRCVLTVQYLCPVTHCTSHRSKRFLFAASAMMDIVHLQHNKSKESLLNSELIKQTQQTTV